MGIGVALDPPYSAKMGIASPELAERVITVIQSLGLHIHHPGLDWTNEDGIRRVFEGIDEFREHLGGELTVLMLQDIGQGVDIHEIDLEVMGACIDELKARSTA